MASEANGLHSRQRFSRDQLALAIFGTGFVTTESGRAFVPLVGRPKLVPPLPAEEQLATSWPRLWHVMVVILISMILAGGSFNGASLNPLTSSAVFIGVPVGAVVLWCWREYVLTNTWDNYPDARIGRTALVVDALERGSLFQVLAMLVGLILYAGWNFHALVWGGESPALPLSQDFSAADIKRWAALVLMVGFYGFLCQAFYRLLLVLVRRMRRSTV